MDPEIAKALAHPVRQTILACLGTHVMTPKSLSKTKELHHLNLSSVSYHVKVLAESGILRLVRTEPRRGSTAHFYEIAPAAYTDIISRRTIPAEARGHVSAPLMQKIIDESVAALESGTLDSHDESELSCVPVFLDSRGCKEVSSAIRQALTKVVTAHEKSAVRMAKSGSPGIDARVIVASFESGKVEKAPNGK